MERATTLACVLCMKQWIMLFWQLLFYMVDYCTLDWCKPHHQLLWWVSAGDGPFAGLPVLLYSVLLAWKTYCLPWCNLSSQDNMAEITKGKWREMTTSHAVGASIAADACDCFRFLLAPPHSCHLDCLGVAVYLSIFGLSGCCCLDMNHEFSSHSLQEMLLASCHGYRWSAQEGIFREKFDVKICLSCLSLFFFSFFFKLMLL